MSNQQWHDDQDEGARIERAEREREARRQAAFSPMLTVLERVVCWAVARGMDGSGSTVAPPWWEDAQEALAQARGAP